MNFETVTVEEARQLVGRTVSLRGHVQAIRRLGAITFIVLRDRTGTIQIVANGSSEGLSDLALEQAVTVRGTVAERQGGSGGIEIQLENLLTLCEPSAGLPVEISREKRMESLGLPALLNYRPLTLRNERVRGIFKIQAAICAAFREFLTREHFTEIHSSKLVSTGTEGGANLFTVEYFGQKAFLAQSPQFYKQIMVGVFERVFEVGPVYRAEEHNTIRHLNEYISLDFEMGFIESERDLIAMETKLLQYIFEYLKEHCPKELELHQAKIPVFTEIPSVTLTEAHAILSKLPLHSGIETPGEPEDLTPEGERALCEYFAREAGIEMVFVTHYPWSVRPFYAMPESGTNKSHSFDLLFRGLEVTTGGQRIHLLSRLIEAMESRGLRPESFEDYLQCFRYGMPPHGGLAIGLERLTKQLLALANIREASLFPRDGNRLSP